MVTLRLCSPNSGQGADVVTYGLIEDTGFRDCLFPGERRYRPGYTGLQAWTYRPTGLDIQAYRPGHTGQYIQACMSRPVCPGLDKGSITVPVTSCFKDYAVLCALVFMLHLATGEEPQSLV